MMIPQMDITQIPFNAHLGLELAAKDTRLLSLPDAPRNLNHLGTIHASAQLALAEATSGEFLLRELGLMPGLIPVVRHVQAKFRRPALGGLTSNARVREGAIETLRLELESRGRALVAVDVEIFDGHESLTMTATFDWFVQMIPEGGAV